MTVKVKTIITFEVEYSLDLEFYETNDEEKALEMEKRLVGESPGGIIESFDTSGHGTFTTKVEKV